MAGCDCICFIVENDHHNWVGGTKEAEEASLHAFGCEFRSAEGRAPPPGGLGLGLGFWWRGSNLYKNGWLVWLCISRKGD